MMDVMKLCVSLAVAAAIGVSAVPEKTPEKQVANHAEVLVAEWPSPGDADTVQHQAPETTSNADAEELRKIAAELKDDAAKIKQLADEQRKIAEGFGSYRPEPDRTVTATCDCDCPDEVRMRTVFREEFAAAVEASKKARLKAAAAASKSTAANPSTAATRTVSRTITPQTVHYEVQQPIYQRAHQQPVYYSQPAMQPRRTGLLGRPRMRSSTMSGSCRVVNGRMTCN
ncbi:MAG: hypothetical protein ACF788_01280 [Novipirellula sp. JB048]